MNRFIAADSAMCIGCRTCEIACALAHEPSRDVETLTPTHFEPRLHLVRTFQVSTVATCHQCEDAPCLHACPTGAIFHSGDTVQVDQARCIGCKSCVIACPFGAMQVVTHPAHRVFAGVTIANGVKAEAHKCDLCAGRATGPACVEVCPTKALHIVDAALLEETRRQRQLHSALEPSGLSAVA